MSDTLFDILLMAGPPGYLILQAVLPPFYRGGWRKAALVPLIATVPIALWCLVAFTQESNLWPLPFLFYAPLAFAYLTALALLHGMVRLARA
ncbi:MAG: hypothetical protein J0I26_10580 [Alphaproteobacteria bacterium]|jgi:hypothetical protein|nr:hypothetical protein [Alphaproteobacteria bacterium]MBN9569058.1 hypothetical protein [Alphaproteobacteria bacterium]MBN9576955.1 hypothetical protein [Alphaproteobacteria bacterium]